MPDMLYRFGELIHDYDSKRGRQLSNVLYLLNLIFIGTYVITTYEFVQPYQQYITLLEFGIGAIFVIEVLGRLRYAESTRAELFSFYTIADILAITPVFLAPLAAGAGGLEFLRIFYSLRAVRFLRLSLANKRFFNYEINNAHVTRVKISLTIGLIFFITAGAFYEVESAVNPNIQNFGDALYYSIVAVSTAGFGDIVPHTQLGRLITMIGLLVAITLIPVQIAQARQANKTNNDLVCDRCGLDDMADDARYCKRCGEKQIDLTE